MNRTSRLVALYLILGICLACAVASILAGEPVPEALYGVLTPVAAFVLLKDKRPPSDDDSEQ